MTNKSTNSFNGFIYVDI